MVRKKKVENHGALEDYIKKGLERGFNVNYIKDVLTQHGHNHKKVETATNNIMGLKHPDELKPHLKEARPLKKKPPYGVLFFILSAILIVVVGYMWFDYFAEKKETEKVQSELEEIQALGLSIDDLSATMKTQLELIKQKDLTIEEKEKIISDQIDIIDEIDKKIEKQRSKINAIILDIMNRMIGRMSS